jgi:hypothetical protein
MVPQALKDIPHWLVWKYVEKIPGKKPSKMPFYSNGRVRGKLKDAPVQIEQGSAEDVELLTSFDMAMTAMSRGRYDGVGFAFLPGDGLIGIDIDGGVDPDAKELTERARMIVEACQSFTELSPSGKGLHIYVRGKTETFKSNDIGVEVFCGSQFFTVTGEQWPGTPERVNDISPQALAMLRGMVQAAKDEKRQARDMAREVNNLQRNHELQQERGQAGPGGVQVPPPVTSAGQPVPRSTGVSAPSGTNDFKTVNAAAMANLDAWVPALFPGAQRAGQGWRVSSKALGRDLQEDIGIHREGIVDFGVADLGDPNEGRRSPIDLVMEWSGNKDVKAALHWLAGVVGVTIAKPGSGQTRRAQPPGGVPPQDPSPPQDQGPPPDGLPEIKWVEGELPLIVDQAEQALIALTEFRLFQKAGMLVRVVRKEVFSSRNYKRPPGVLGTVMVDAPHLTELLTRGAVWKRFDARLQKDRRINAPEKVASTYLSRAYNWKLPILWSTIAAPTLRPDGSILQTPGYDPATRSFYDPGDHKFPQVPDCPTIDQARAALELISKAISTFPFEERVDRSVALAAVLTALVRRSLPSAPLFVVTAPSPESGKTLLCDFIALLAMGTAVPAMKYPDNDEEAVKIAMAILLEGDPVVMIDNIERPLQGDWLCTMLTSEVYKGRILGRSEMGNLNTNCLWLANGNRVIVAGDLRHRTLLCRLDAEMERPGERVFEHDLRVWATEHRAQLVSAGLTVMRAFFAAKANPRDYCPPWGRFEQWTDMVRAPLIWLGEKDPCASLAALEEEDPARQEHLAILAAWYEAFCDNKVTAREVIKDLNEAGVDYNERMHKLRELIKEIAEDNKGEMRPKRLASWLRRHAGRRVEGYQLVKVGEKDHTTVWQVKKVKDE